MSTDGFQTEVQKIQEVLQEIQKVLQEIQKIIYCEEEEMDETESDEELPKRSKWS